MMILQYHFPTVCLLVSVSIVECFQSPTVVRRNPIHYSRIKYQGQNSRHGCLNQELVQAVELHPGRPGSPQPRISLCLSVKQDNGAFGEGETFLRQESLSSSPPKINSSAFLQGQSDASLTDQAFYADAGTTITTNTSTTASTAATSATGAIFWRGVVVVLCALWASNFAIGKLIMGEPGVDYALYGVTRFSIAALALTPFLLKSLTQSGPNRIDAETLKDAAVTGSWVAFGYIGQLLGLLTTTASRSCVICTLQCVFVAVVAELARASKVTSNRSEKTDDSEATSGFDFQRIGPAILAFAGVAIIELQGAAGAPTIGDALSFAQPIGFGMGYLQLEEIMKSRPDAALPVSAIKLLMVAMASLVVFEIGPVVDGMDWVPRVPDFDPILASPIALGGVLYTGLATTALALWIESIAFVQVSATDATIILATEPLFAASLGAYSLGEVFGTSDYVGATLIIGACVLAAFQGAAGHEE